MKTMFRKFTLLMLLVVLIASMADAQGSKTLKDSNYANDSTYTLTPPFNLASYRTISLQISAPDSFSAKTYLDTRVKGTTAWTVTDSLTITNATTAATNSEWVLRNNTTEKISGIAVEARFRMACAASGNTTTPTQRAQAVIWYSK